MKKQLLSFAAILSLFAATAQGNLTGTSQIGYTAPIIIASAATATTVPVSTSGAGVTWNCSNLQQETGTPVVNYTISSPSGTMYASDYPNSNWYFTDPAISSLIGHHYYSLTADSLVLWGAHTPGSNYEIYDNPEMELPLPFSFNSTVVNTYSKTNYYSNGSVSSYQTGTNTITYDSYGTLILPNGTFNNVARVTNVRTNSLGPTTTCYRWYLISTGEKLLEYETNGGVKVVYNNNAPTFVNEESLQSLQVKVFPNPSSGNFTVKIASQEVVTAQLKIYDVLGKEIRSLQITSNEQHFSCTDLAGGVYHYRLEADGKTLNSGKLAIN